MKLIAKVSLALALALGTAAAPSIADACGGGYGEEGPSPRRLVLSVAHRSVARRTGFEITSLRFADEEHAEVEIRTAAGEGKHRAQLLWFTLENGAWKEDGRSYAVVLAASSPFPFTAVPTAPSTPAVASR
jgi:hypothetical protein